jgi:hypothetical protein
MTYGTPEDDDLIVAIVLEGVESAALRRMLEHVVREGDLQRACILKEMLQHNQGGPRHA